ncbi:hypothetical protein HMPREF2758_00115 [Facklamia sp. HMSC062C11]|uniref:TIGR01906 family membrane protein n=1 Tax=Facklamia hominis TaxID=178214 RepID=A0AAJ1Q5D8_9LACT|nr:MULTISPECIES: TIGR01906 family membrane protein [Facklamia]MDK7188018.1 TIGR01906 family membrane protein [Facklamia hominis]OFL68497.1 hypothetical protein HMPREF2758_00115 [Facklamia sp. HMSC062C11]
MKQITQNFFMMLHFVLFSLSLAICLVFLFSSFLYAFFLKFTQLPQMLGLSEQQILVNFNALIEYILNPKTTKLSLPDFSFSQGGLQHFIDVKLRVQILFLIMMILLVVSIYLCFKIRLRKRKIPGISLFFKGGYLLPLVVLFIAVFAFEPLFVTFHQIFFNNQLWLFDPLTDPVINMLPQSLFLYFLIWIILFYEIIMMFIQFILRKKIN